MSTSHDDDGLGTTSTTHIKIDGTLADRVRNRFSMPAAEEVIIVEDQYEWGDYTKETAAEFTVICGDRRVTFIPENPDYDFDVHALTWRDSVYARFNTWLQAVERPRELLTEWFALDRAPLEGVVDSGARRYAMDHDLVMGRDTAIAIGRRRSRGNLDILHIAGEYRWQIDVINDLVKDGAAIFGEVVARIRGIPKTAGPLPTDDEARKIAEFLTDQWMPGQPRV